jgi:hypothetical protein
MTTGVVRAIVLAVAVSGSVAVALLPLAAERVDSAGRAAPREIVVVARDMAFFVPGTSAPNPDIAVERGEQIALTLRNEDLGIVHDFAIPGWGVETRRVDGLGSARVVFTVPDGAAAADYLCTPHAAMMFGRITVRQEPR